MTNRLFDKLTIFGIFPQLGALWFGFSVAGGITCNPALIAAGAQFGNMVMDEIID
jgi:hypothetical protein